MSSNFELVQKYGSTVFVIYKYLEEYPYASPADISKGTGLSDKCVKYCLRTLVSVKLLNKIRASFSKHGHGYRYTTVDETVVQ